MFVRQILKEGDIAFQDARHQDGTGRALGAIVAD